MIFCHADKAEEIMKVVQELLDILGWTISPAKNQIPGKENGYTIKVLGMNYTFEENAVEVEAPQERKERTLKKEEEILEKLDKQEKMAPKDIQIILGAAIWTFLFRHMVLIMLRPLYLWTLDKYFYANIKKRSMREQLKTLLRSLVASGEKIKPLRITGLGVIQQAWTDASREGSEAKAGGLWTTAEKEIKGFKTKNVKNAFAELAKRHDVPKAVFDNIYVYELLAIAIAVKLMPKKEEKRVFHVDNTAAIFAAVSGMSKHPLGAAIVATILKDLEKKEMWHYFVYIPSEDNPSDPLSRECGEKEKEEFPILRQVILEDEEEIDKILEEIKDDAEKALLETAIYWKGAPGKPKKPRSRQRKRRRLE